MRGIIIDNFAGGGGASLGIERAINRPIDYAVNHDPEAIVMHRGLCDRSGIQREAIE